MFVSAQLCEDSVRDGADAHLQAGSVLYEFRAVFSDGCFHLIRLAEMTRYERRIVFHENIYQVRRYHGLTPRTRNIRVYYRYDSLRTFYGCQCGIH